MNAISRIMLILLALTSHYAHANTPPLIIYTYSSFVSEWGPGPAIKEGFEANCTCEIKFVALEDGAALLNRLQLEGTSSKADIVLGLDTSLIHEARATKILTIHGLPLENYDLTLDWKDDVFIPYDYGHFAFIYDSDTIQSPARSLRELVEDKEGPRLIIQDPRTSTPGLGLLLWMRAVFGESAAEAWTNLAPRILTVTAGWSQAYGLFLEGEAPLVLSYTTSPAYHRHVEMTDRYKAAEFSEGHYTQIEVAAKLKTSTQQDLASQFLEFMLSSYVQTLIPTTNWMFPVTKTDEPLPEAFTNLVTPVRTLLIEPQEVAKYRRQWVMEWLEALSRSR
ncbi:MAG: thiamine ABC transporter substrate binding subunit [Acidiferrobacteraceae bacterium]|nr:thiamine ABC transporter substrate binding subunit [Acidiferrobacteraceae bacterium]